MPSPAINFNLVNGKNNSIIKIGFPDNKLDEWINLRVKFLLSENRLIFYTPDSSYIQEDIGLKSDDSFKIFFGACDYENFKTSDVPSMNIRDVRISEKGKLKYHWPLDEEESNVAKNRQNRKVAFVKNPLWLKSAHQTWQTKYQDEIEGIASVAFDTENGKIFLVGSNELTVYLISSGAVQSIKYREKPVFLNSKFKSTFNSSDKKIYSFLLDDKLLYSLNTATGEWSKIDTPTVPEKIFGRHFNSYFSPAENSMYVFGGYGNFTYSNEIRKIDLAKNSWQSLPTDKNVFPPRYLAGLGFLNDTVYILGGYGSVTGSQMVNPHSYFDLLGYSVKNQSLFKKFEIPRLIDDMCVANNMWIDNKTRDYYALIFEKMKFDGTLQMIKGNIDDPKVDFVGDKIPYQFQDRKSYASLSYFPKQNKLFAYTLFEKDSSSMQVCIYSIDYPPNKSNIETLDIKPRKNAFFIYPLIALLFLSASLSWYIIRKKRIKRGSPGTITTNEFMNAEPERSTPAFMNENPKYHMVLFGGFQVFNANQKDITNRFSPLLKELFLLILLHTHKNNKGISSEKISEYLWFDKSELSSKNNRAVNIAKLKNILAEIGAIELTRKTGYWKIGYDNEYLKCDYAEFLQITGSKANITKQNVSRLMEIAQKGPFLMDVNYDWLDDFKSDVSDRIVDTLMFFAEKSDIKTDAEFIVHLADCIFNFDLSNEEAMVLKCNAQYYLGKHSLAKSTYEKFTRKYQQLYDEEYKRSFNEVISAKL